MEIHKNANEFINKNTDEAAGLLPDNIVSDVEVEKKSLSSFPLIYGLDDDFKKDVMDFMNLEVDLGVLKEPISQDKIFWDGN